MRAWLEPRREDPELFEKGVGVWWQELDYEDSLICSWMSQLAHEESGGEPSTIFLDSQGLGPDRDGQWQGVGR